MAFKYMCWLIRLKCCVELLEAPVVDFRLADGLPRGANCVIGRRYKAPHAINTDSANHTLGEM